MLCTASTGLAGLFASGSLSESEPLLCIVGPGCSSFPEGDLSRRRTRYKYCHYSSHSKSARSTKAPGCSAGMRRAWTRLTLATNLWLQG